MTADAMRLRQNTAILVYRIENTDQLDRARGVLSIVPSSRSYEVWSPIRVGDTLLTISIEGDFAIHRGVVAEKNILDMGDDPLTSKQRLLICFESLERAAVDRIDLRVLATFQHGGVLSHTTQNQVFRKLEFQRLQITAQDLRSRVFPYRIDGTRFVDVVAREDEDKALKSLARNHPFGDADGSIRLVLRDRRKVIAGAIVRLSYDHMPVHDTELAIFGRSAHSLRSLSLSVARLLSVHRFHRKQRDFVSLLKAISYMAPSVYAEPTSYIAGVSYDLILAALMSGFFVNIPSRRYGSLFYWKPVFAQGQQTTHDSSTVRQNFKRFVRDRHQSAWVVMGDQRAFENAKALSRWAIADNPANRGVWRSVQPEDELYICANGRFIVASGTIASTGRTVIEGFERYPLGFQLKQLNALAKPIDLARVVTQEWLASQPRAPILGIPPDLHFSLMRQIEETSGGRRMWVTPNPYLLHQTRFTTVPKSVFVIQAWDLKDTILPILEQVCRNAGWIVSHARDREGQVVFNDIWLMLNQSEAVIVDFTMRRPNVYLEFGMALVLGKPIIAITQDEKDLPSDTPNLKYRKYRGDSNAFSDLEKKIPVALFDTVEDMRSVTDQPVDDQSVRHPRLP